MNRLDTLFFAMIQFDTGSAERIQHFTKVHSYGRLIGLGENLDHETLEILEATTYVHDIGIRIAEEKYGKSNGKLQEELGPSEAKKMLESVGYTDENFINKVCYLVGHHHTYSNINSIEYQILVEADFLVNLYERGSGKKEIDSVRNKIFKTKTGCKIFDLMFFK
ncbi:MAG: phosphohydrolase [Treponema sp. CETP13]|nr:MAG: phosphohydrolase [Treponema sp. CETP13]